MFRTILEPRFKSPITTGFYSYQHLRNSAKRFQKTLINPPVRNGSLKVQLRYIRKPAKRAVELMYSAVLIRNGTIYVHVTV